MTATPGQPDDVTLAVVAARLEDVRVEMRGMRQDLASHRAELVPRGEWEQRNRHVDSRFQEMGREIGTLRVSLEAAKTSLEAKVAASEQRAEQRRAPWWAVLSSVAGLISVSLVVINYVAN